MSDADDALAIGMDVECMRICSLIDDLIATRSNGSYGKGQRFILRELKQRIFESANHKESNVLEQGDGNEQPR